MSNCISLSQYVDTLTPRQFPALLFLESDPKEGERRSWRADAVFLAIPPRLALPPLISWEPSLPAEIVGAAKATPTWMGEATKAGATCLEIMFDASRRHGALSRSIFVPSSYEHINTVPGPHCPPVVVHTPPPPSPPHVPKTCRFW